MDELTIRDRILTRFAAHCELDLETGEDEPSFCIDREALVTLVKAEFGVNVPVELIPEEFTVDWLVGMVQQLTGSKPYVM